MKVDEMVTVVTVEVVSTNKVHLVFYYYYKNNDRTKLCKVVDFVKINRQHYKLVLNNFDLSIIIELVKKHLSKKLLNKVYVEKDLCY